MKENLAIPLSTDQYEPACENSVEFRVKRSNRKETETIYTDIVVGQESVQGAHAVSAQSSWERPVTKYVRIDYIKTAALTKANQNWQQEKQQLQKEYSLTVDSEKKTTQVTLHNNQFPINDNETTKKPIKSKKSYQFFRFPILERAGLKLIKGCCPFTVGK